MKNPKTQNQNSGPQQKEDYGESLSLSFLGVREVAFYLGVKPSTIYAMVERKGIPHYRVGRLVRFKKSEIDEWMDSQKEPVVDVKVETKKVIRSIERRPSLNVDTIAKKAIDGVRQKRYTCDCGNPDQTRGLRKEVDDGYL